MIIYKRKITPEDVISLKNHEELIYYKTKDIAITVDKINDGYLVRKKEISKNKKTDEIFLRTTAKTLAFIENQI